MRFPGHTNATNLAYGGKIRVDVDINGESTRVVHLKLPLPFSLEIHVQFRVENVVSFNLDALEMSQRIYILHLSP